MEYVSFIHVLTENNRQSLVFRETKTSDLKSFIQNSEIIPMAFFLCNNYKYLWHIPQSIIWALLSSVSRNQKQGFLISGYSTRYRPILASIWLVCWIWISGIRRQYYVDLSQPMYALLFTSKARFRRCISSGPVFQILRYWGNLWHHILHRTL